MNKDSRCKDKMAVNRLVFVMGIYTSKTASSYWNGSYDVSTGNIDAICQTLIYAMLLIPSDVR